MSNREQFAAYISDEETRKALAPLVEQRGWASNMIFGGNITAAVRALGAMACPHILIVDVSDSPDPRQDISSLAEVCEPDTIVIALGTENDVSLYRDMMHIGVHDYLVKPVSADVFADALDTAEDAMHAEQEAPADAASSSSHRIVIVGMRGGLGASAVASNLAWLRAEKGENTALLDLDLYFGTSAMQFDLEPGRGLCDALENPGRVDGLFLERAVIKPRENFSILCAEAPVGSLASPADGAFNDLVQALGENFDTVITDIPRQTLGEHGDILEAATDVYLVCDYSLVCARDTIRMIAHLQKFAPDAEVKILISKAGLSVDEVSEKDFENSVEMSVSTSIPYEPKVFLNAEKQGQLVVSAAGASKAALAMKALSNQLDGGDEEIDAQSGWLKSIFKKAS